MDGSRDRGRRMTRKVNANLKIQFDVIDASTFSAADQKILKDGVVEQMLRRNESITEDLDA